MIIYIAGFHAVPNTHPTKGDSWTLHEDCIDMFAYRRVLRSEARRLLIAVVVVLAPFAVSSDSQRLVMYRARILTWTQRYRIRVGGMSTHPTLPCSR